MAVREHYTKVCHCEWTDDELPTRTMTSEKCSIHGAVPDPLDALVAQRERLAECLEEACDWLDADLAENPTPVVELADRELIARWRAEL